MRFFFNNYAEVTFEQIKNDPCLSNDDREKIVALHVNESCVINVGKSKKANIKRIK